MEKNIVTQYIKGYMIYVYIYKYVCVFKYKRAYINYNCILDSRLCWYYPVAKDYRKPMSHCHPRGNDKTCFERCLYRLDPIGNTVKGQQCWACSCTKNQILWYFSTFRCTFVRNPALTVKIQILRLSIKNWYIIYKCKCLICISSIVRLLENSSLKRLYIINHWWRIENQFPPTQDRLLGAFFLAPTWHSLPPRMEKTFPTVCRHDWHDAMFPGGNISNTN